MAVGERVLLSSGQDLPVLCFRFEKHTNTMKFVHTDKLGTPIEMIDISANTDSLNMEYYLKLQSWFLFKHEVARAFEIPHYLTVKGEKADVFEYLLGKQQQGEQRIRITFKAAEVITVAV